MDITLTPAAITKVRAIMATQDPLPNALRIGIVGGGCSGFQYAMLFERECGPLDKTFEVEGLQVVVDPASLVYLKGCTIDYLETLEVSGFQFGNPNVKNTCGCGHSFNA